MEIITVCGSLKFKEEMISSALKMELLGNVVITPIMPNGDNKDDFTEEEFKILGDMHKEKIKLADSILVINVDHYIGTSTKREIEYAKKLNRKILYYTDLKEEGIL